MKKMLYILLIAFVSALTVTSCTEEEITPSTQGGGGSDYDPPK